VRLHLEKIPAKLPAICFAVCNPLIAKTCQYPKPAHLTHASLHRSHSQPRAFRFPIRPKRNPEALPEAPPEAFPEAAPEPLSTTI